MKCPYNYEECMSDCVNFIELPGVPGMKTVENCRVALWYEKNLKQTELLIAILTDLNSMQKQEGGILKAMLKVAGLG